MSIYDSDDDWGNPVEHHYDSINHGNFWYNSPLCNAMYGYSDDQFGKALLVNAKGTYFERLPYELILKIMEMVRILLDKYERSFFNEYFDEKNSCVVVLRSLRITKKQQLEIDGSNISKHPGIKILETPIGNTMMRKIHFRNAASECYYYVANVIVSGSNGIGLKELKEIYRMMSVWMIWMCDHYNIRCWERLVNTIINKVYEFHRCVKRLLDDIDKPTLKLPTKVEMSEAYDITSRMKYFIESYIPYAMLVRSDNYHNSRKDNGFTVNDHKECLYSIFGETRMHPNDINVDDAYEFEMELYDPEYYYNTYLQYKRLRSGRLLIPKGEKPCFYWCGNTYTRRFI